VADILAKLTQSVSKGHLSLKQQLEQGQYFGRQLLFFFLDAGSGQSRLLH